MAAGPVVARRVLTAMVGLVALLGLLLAASAAGGLDPGFGSGGKVTTELGLDSIAWAVAVQRDGKPVIGGFTTMANRGAPGGLVAAWVVIRYTQDGRLDATFDGDGIVVTSFSSAPYTWDSVQDLAVQPDGKIVAAGRATSGGSRHFAVARYNPDGSLDSSFGSGGKVVTDFGTDAAPTDDRVEAIAPAADGKIVAAGSTRLLAQTDTADFALARYRADGTLDASFGIGGRVVTDFGADDVAKDVALLGDGRIVAAGVKGDIYARDPQIALARYNVNGTLDSTFGFNGKHLLGPGVATSILVQTDGKLLLAGGGQRGEILPSLPLLRRYDASGVSDESYGLRGSAVVDPAEYSFGALAFDSHGRTLVVGTAGPSGDLLVARYTKTGRLDGAFGKRGYVETDYGSSDEGLAVAVASDGKIVAAGTASQEGSRHKIALARYLPTYCLVPRVTGKPSTAAKRAIARAHCSLGKVRRAYSKTIAKDRVIAQTPAAGARLVESSLVNLTVSSGKKKR